MESEERDIIDYLKSWPDLYISPREISRRAGGKWRFREDEGWSKPVLMRMLEKGLVEEDSDGRYRLVMDRTEKRKEVKPRWISPAVQKILAKGSSGGNAVKAFDLGTPDAFYDTPSTKPQQPTEPPRPAV